MNDSATSLDRLHDIVLPPPIPWWPPAPGWYAVIAITLCASSMTVWLGWKHWRANAYRRKAMRELAEADSAASISELLRRAALAVEPRSDVAAPIGEYWPDWLVAHCSYESLSADVRDQLTNGAYRQPPFTGDVHALRNYAERWLARHHDSPPER